MKITYTDALDNITPERLRGGFFEGWLHPPTPETHLRLLQGSAQVVLACDGQAVVGYVTAITDGVLAAFIPHLEVLPAYRGHGIGSELVRRMLTKLRDLYAIDLVCDPDVQPFYEKLGMTKYTSMILRHYDRQAGD